MAGNSNPPGNPGSGPPPGLAAPVTVLRGVGPERAAQLARLEIHTVEALLLHRPRRYEDRRRIYPIAQLPLGVAAATRGRIVAQGVKYWRQRTRSLFELILDDGTGRLHCRFWQMPYLENSFAVGQELFAFGKLASLKPRAVDHPETEVIEAGEEASVHLHRLVPVYPLTEGLPQRWLRALLWRVSQQAPAGLDSGSSRVLPGLPSRAEAIRHLHFPDELAQAEAARRRLALDELIELQTTLQRRRRNLEQHAQGLPCGGDNRLQRPFLAHLGFPLTAAQTAVLRELRRDLSGPHPMRRLLQGDVGSGKTVVAACAALMAIESGFQVALMAPTEILAEQHWRTFGGWFGPLGVPLELRTGDRRAASVPAPDPRGAASPRTLPVGGLTLGTHALLEGDFAPANLGLVIIDEQHKFGVSQRERLVRKGSYPHLLVMTATPIPRTLGLTLYGDLDLSLLDAPPPGRGPIHTYVRAPAQLAKVHAFIRQQLAKGRQAYVVYPRVEEGDLAKGLKAVEREVAQLKEAFAPARVGLLHGRLGPEAKEAVMAGFRANDIQVLVATSAIEVGVDVPNATVMLIENAQSFGLAQLHQLRGRIGRGPHPSYCILVADAQTPEARQRLRVLATSTDGFRIAEEDLRLRGPGELVGQAQSGLPRFRFADLAADLDLVEQARALAAQPAA